MHLRIPITLLSYDETMDISSGASLWTRVDRDVVLYLLHVSSCGCGCVVVAVAVAVAVDVADVVGRSDVTMSNGASLS